MVLANVLQSGGALLGGAVFAWTAGYRAIYPMAAVCFAVSALVLTRLAVEKPATDRAAPSAVPSGESAS